MKKSTLKDLSEQRFDRLVVLSRHFKPIKTKRVYWLCRCDCGNETVVMGINLRRRHTKSCGCLHREITSKKNSTHGMSKSAEYRCWNQMKERCLNPAVKTYHRYGGRGIKVCERWMKFENFLADMKRKPSPQHTLERRDNNGDYCPENCYWATRTEQARNRSTTVILHVFGKDQTLHQLSEIAGISAHRISIRIGRGWNVKDAVLRPLRESGIRKITSAFSDKAEEAAAP